MQANPFLLAGKAQDSITGCECTHSENKTNLFTLVEEARSSLTGGVCFLLYLVSLAEWKKTNLFTLVEEAQSSLTGGECSLLYLLPSCGQLLPLLLKVLTGTKKYKKLRWERTTIMHIFNAYNSNSMPPPLVRRCDGTTAGPGYWKVGLALQHSPWAVNLWQHHQAGGCGRSEWLIANALDKLATIQIPLY